MTIVKPDKYLKPKISRRIIKFFIDNPSSIDTPRGIATWINANVDETEKTLKKLTKAKILVSHGAGTTSAYGFTADANIVSAIKAAIK